MFCSDPSPMLTRIFHSLGGLQQGVSMVWASTCEDRVSCQA